MIFCRHGHGELRYEWDRMLYCCSECGWTMTKVEVVEMFRWTSRPPHPPSKLHPLVQLDAELQKLDAS